MTPGVPTPTLCSSAGCTRLRPVRGRTLHYARRRYAISGEVEGRQGKTHPGGAQIRECVPARFMRDMGIRLDLPRLGRGRTAPVREGARAVEKIEHLRKSLPSFRRLPPNYIFQIHFASRQALVTSSPRCARRASKLHTARTSHRLHLGAFSCWTLVGLEREASCAHVPESKHFVSFTRKTIIGRGAWR